MKYLLTLFIVVLLNSSFFAQASVCGQFHRKYCILDGGSPGKWQYNAQSKSGLFNQGMVSKLRCVIYKGMDYRISVCCDVTIGDKVSYKIFDSRTNELLFDNAAAEDTQIFEFQSVSTRQLVIEVVVLLPISFQVVSDTDVTISDTSFVPVLLGIVVVLIVVRLA